MPPLNVILLCTAGLNFLSVYAALTVNYFWASRPEGGAAAGILTAACVAAGLFLVSVISSIFW
jgi:hypothetical protein